MKCKNFATNLCPEVMSEQVQHEQPSLPLEEMEKAWGDHIVPGTSASDLIGVQPMFKELPALIYCPRIPNLNPPKKRRVLSSR
jgi:hypothetical protein